ncbi:MAG TPA: hypothetical protein G4O03_01645 [Dehalococcoidia bacterium]|nr:hypothetical protein [Dehalococcoidia bacterium]
MIDWILRELEKHPNTLFYEKELKVRDAAEFTKMRRERLLGYVQPDDRSETYGVGQAKPLSVVNIGGELYGIDDEDAEKDPVHLRKTDLARYSFSLDRFIDKLRAVNNLLGSASPLDKRLFFAGEKTVNGKRVAFVFALLDSEKRAADLLLTLPSRVSPNHDRIAVVTPSFTVKSEAVRAQLERLRIYVMPLGDTMSLETDVSSLFKEAPQPSPSALLTSEQEEEFARYGYKSRLPIYITGDVEKRATNIVEINETRVPIGDAAFTLFLRLVVELKKNKKGSVSKSTLIRGGYIKADGEFQAIARLRQAFNAALGWLAPQEFIEAPKPKTLRLSTHPDLVTYDKEKLLRHSNEKIRRLARRLPG